MRLKLSPGEMAVAWCSMAMRRAVNRSAGLTDYLFGYESPEAKDFNGLCAEMAFCKWKNLFCDLSIETRSGGIDCVGRDGESIDVKCTTKKDGNLVVYKGKADSKCDHYVLAIVMGPGDIDFIGWATKEDVFDHGTLNDEGPRPFYLLHRKKLRPF